jgi:hypothetical protein
MMERYHAEIAKPAESIRMVNPEQARDEYQRSQSCKEEPKLIGRQGAGSHIPRCAR